VFLPLVPRVRDVFWSAERFICRIAITPFYGVSSVGPARFWPFLIRFPLFGKTAGAGSRSPLLLSL